MADKPLVSEEVMELAIALYDPASLAKILMEHDSENWNAMKDIAEGELEAAARVRQQQEEEK